MIGSDRIAGASSFRFFETPALGWSNRARNARARRDGMSRKTRDDVSPFGSTSPVMGRGAIRRLF